jgi:hypothetical protein
VLFLASIADFYGEQNWSNIPHGGKAEVLMSGRGEGTTQTGSADNTERVNDFATADVLI